MRERVSHSTPDFVAKGECGHCLAAFVAMIPASTRVFAVAEMSDGFLLEATVTAECGSCGALNLFRGLTKVLNARAQFNGRLFWKLIEDAGDWFDVQQWPSLAVPEIPEEIPISIAGMFEQAEKALAVTSWSLAGVGYRAAIDRATKELGETQGSLAKRIEALKKASTITPALADWAHEVRLGGNEGAHDLDDLTEQEAKELRDFAKLFLEMAFTMPKRIADAQMKREAEKSI